MNLHDKGPLEDAREHALRRIDELRERGSIAATPGELRSLLQRAEGHVDDLRGTAQELAAVLPTRVEAAVARALRESSGGFGKRLAEVRDETRETARAIDRIERDLLAERLGRVEDLEVLVGLLTDAMTTLRRDIARIAERLDEVGASLDAPLHVTVERERRPGGMRFAARVEDVEPAASPRPVPPSPPSA
jgi:hypothetical protein